MDETARIGQVVEGENAFILKDGRVVVTGTVDLSEEDMEPLRARGISRAETAVVIPIEMFHMLKAEAGEDE